MDKLPFVIWLIGWPLVCSIESYLYFLRVDQKPSESAQVLASLINFAIWIFIARKL